MTTYDELLVATENASLASELWEKQKAEWRAEVARDGYAWNPVSISCRFDMGGIVEAGGSRFRMDPMTRRVERV